MADRNLRLSINAPGAWYVDETCIACGLCCEVAPDTLELDLPDGHLFVKRQPDTEAELAAAAEAMEQCPVGAIGNV